MMSAGRSSKPCHQTPWRYVPEDSNNLQDVRRPKRRGTILYKTSLTLPEDSYCTMVSFPDYGVSWTFTRPTTEQLQPTLPKWRIPISICIPSVVLFQN
jgi:hypothetical protein